MEQVRGMIDTYMRSPHQRGPKPARSRVRVGRVVYVADSVAQAKHELRDAELRHAYGRMQHLIPPGGSNARKGSYSGLMSTWKVSAKYSSAWAS